MNFAEEFYIFSSSQVQSLGNNFLWEVTGGVSPLFYGKVRTAAIFFFFFLAAEILRITYIEKCHARGSPTFPLTKHNQL